MKILVDSREQAPWRFPDDIETARATLATGDYSVAGLESHVCIERKSLSDLVACLGVERDRFKRELARMRAFALAVVVVEGSLQQLADG